MDNMVCKEHVFDRMCPVKEKFCCSECKLKSICYACCHYIRMGFNGKDCKNYLPRSFLD